MKGPSSWATVPNKTGDCFMRVYTTGYLIHVWPPSAIDLNRCHPQRGFCISATSIFDAPGWIVCLYNAILQVARFLTPTVLTPGLISFHARISGPDSHRGIWQLTAQHTRHFRCSGQRWKCESSVPCRYGIALGSGARH